ncbi:MAG TPA: chloride channel protein [Solirubrobacteraceae bacterium]|nr:chloride channel protein [Solirubrobacteraceae bacterium]
MDRLFAKRVRRLRESALAAAPEQEAVNGSEPLTSATVAPASGPPARTIAWMRRSIASGSTALTALALLVGAGAGAGAIAFRYMILGLTYVFSGHRDYSAAGHAANPWVPGLGIYFVVLAPVLGGLLYGPLVSRFAPEARGHGVPEVMYAVNRLGGRMRPQVPVVKSLASALCIGSGGSVGREGPIVQIGSALGSVLGQALRVSESQLRLLVACGAAGGISATFNAPIAGVFFALELILRNFETRSFGLVVLSSVTADAIGRAAFGSHAFLKLPAFNFSSPVELLLYAGLGVLATGVGLAFVRVLYSGEDLSDRLWSKRPDWARPAVGGALLGLLLLAVPQMYGVGYPVLEKAVGGHYVILALLGLMAAKILATSLTMSIGGSGGVFAPSLFIGATLGAAYGAVAHRLIPGLAAAAGAYGLVGMGAVFAASSRAPITAVLVIFELTGDYRIILPLMIAVVVATALSNAITRDTIYTLKLRRRGIDIEAPTGAAALMAMSVAEALGPPPDTLAADTPLADILARFAELDADTLPVLASDGALIGVLSAAAVESALGEREDRPTAGSLARAAPELHAGQSLEDAVLALAASEEDGLPVLAQDGRAMVGWLTHRRLLSAYRSRLPERRDVLAQGTRDDRRGADRVSVSRAPTGQSPCDHS